MARFGTDGIRGPAGVGPLSPAAVVRLGRVLGGLIVDGALERDGAESPAVPCLLVGRDSRTSGAMLTAALAAGAMAAGVDVADAGLLPTPAVAAATRAGYAAGAVISASHNPPADNGIKLLDAGGVKLSHAIEARIEAGLDGDEEPPPGARFGVAAEDPQAAEGYLDELSSEFADDGLAGLTVVLDCGRGAGCATGPALLERLGLTVHAVNAQPDGARINVGCGALAPMANADAVRARGADLAICLDGDADRAILIDELGQRVDGDAILALCGIERHDRGALPAATIVGTVMSNLGLERALAERGITLARAKVGDTNVAKTMRETGAVVGGEESGHIIITDGGHPFGDGMHTALQVMRVMRRTGRPLSELARCFERFPQARRNLTVRDKPPLAEIGGLAEATAAVEADGMRVLVRYSGTEALARVLVEGVDADGCEAAADRLAGVVSAAIGA